MLVATLLALSAACGVLAAPYNTQLNKVQRTEYPQYETEEECHAAGWEVCRRYVVSPGVSLWTGYPGPAEPPIPVFATEAECKAVYKTCLGYKRASGQWEWRGVEESTEDDSESVDTSAPIEAGDDTVPPTTTHEEEKWYDTEAECLADGWGYCRRYAVDVGVSKWTGFPGSPPPVTKKYASEAECLAERTYCISYQRADRSWVWLGADELADSESV